MMRRYSPFVYGFNNPIRFTDPDGMKPQDIIIVGTKNYRQKVFNQLQMLTSQKLTMKAGGKIEMSGAPSGGLKPVGTDLVETLANSKHKIVIEIGQSKDLGNKTRYEDGDFSSGKKPGGIGSTIRFNPDSSEDAPEGVRNVDGTLGRPAQIGLAHELIHAEDGVKGRSLQGVIKAYDPDDISGKPGDVEKDEVKTRKKENIIRSERYIDRAPLVPLKPLS